MALINKKQILIILAFAAGICWTSSAYATTWYVRDGGGNASQCTGKTNAIYTGVGSGQECAFNHPRYIFGWGCGNRSSCVNPGVMAGGDTLFIVGDSDINPGSQAQYMIGYDDAGNGAATPGCSSSYPYDCTLGTIPAGLSPTQPTTIKGIGTLLPQFWGQERPWYLLNATNGNLDLENIEMTQHSACVQYGGDPNGTVDGFPAVCVQNTYPYGPWAPIALYLEGMNITTSNLYIHGMAHTSIYFPGNVGNWNSSNDRFIAAGWFHTDGSTMTFSGNNTQTNDIWAFGGCGEHYPLPDPGNIKDLANYHHCCDQNCGDLGGGFMMQNDGNASCGNWTISNSQFLFNLKTNIDFLHCNSTGTFNLYRSRSEGSTGEALKLNVATANIENSQLIANAPIWTTPPFTAILSPLNTSGGTYSPILCRGGAVTIFGGSNNAQINYINSDVMGNCSSLVETTTLGCPNCTCTGMSINATNSKFIGGYDYFANRGSQVDVLYNAGSDGDGGGQCGTGAVAFNEDYNSIYDVNDPAHCTGSHSICGTNPEVLGPLANGPTSYYSGTSYGDLLYLTSVSPLKGNGTSNAVFTNGSSNDYNNFPQNSPPDIGAIQYNSCIAANNMCSISGECCGGASCTNATCGGIGGGNINGGGPTTPTNTPSTAQPIVNITSPVSGSTFTAGTDVTITASASETNGSISNISIFNSTGTLLGSSSSSPYNFVDSNVLTGTYTFTAQATDANGVSVTSNPITITVIEPSPPAVILTSPANGSSFTSGSNITITASASETNGTIAQVAFYNGTNLLGTATSSPYSFTWNNAAAGNYSLTAIATDANGVTVTSSPVSITITAPVTASSPVVSLISPANGNSITSGSNVTITASASETNGTISQVAFYNGSTLLGTATSSPYSFTWNNVAAGNYTLTTIATDANGVTVTSNALTLTVTSPTTPATTTTSTSPGVPAVNGSGISISSPLNNASYTVPASIILTSNAFDSSAAIVRVDYYAGSIYIGEATSSPYTVNWSSAQEGTYSLTAKATDSSGVPFYSAPITVTVNPHSAPAVALTSPASNASYAVPANIVLTANASAGGGSITKVDFYNGTLYLGTVYSSPYTINWNNVQIGNYSVTAKATDSYGWSTISPAVNITVGAPPSPPTVSITAPSNNASYYEPASITLTASASETNGTISKVAFYNGSTLLGTDTNSPYSFTWNNVPAGNYTLTAVTTDASGVTATSNPISVTVNSVSITANTPVTNSNGTTANGSTISLTSPVNNASYTVPATIPLTSTASDNNATIARVDYYAGTIFLGEATSSPYSVNWTSAQAGTYSLTANATDSNGAVFTSAPVNITVNTHSAPTVNLTSPTDNTSYTGPADIVLTANALAGGGSITKVDFYSGTLYLGTDYNSPYSINWNNVQSGNYSLTAKATDSYGWSTTSPAINVVVTNASNAPTNNSPALNNAPTVTLTAPSNNATFTAPASITLTANASEANGNIRKVVFYNGSTKIRTDWYSPYSYTLSNLPAGNYNFTAVAEDANGATTTSSSVSVTVNPPNAFSSS